MVYRDYDNVTTLSGNPVVANSDAAYANAANYDANGNWIGAAADTHPYLDIGGYGSATPTKGQQGQAGRTPARNNVDFHLDWTKKFGKFRLIPSVDMFNMFNTRYAISQRQQATDQGGAPDVRYGYATNWQTGRRFRFGVKLQF